MNENQHTSSDEKFEGIVSTLEVQSFETIKTMLPLSETFAVKPRLIIRCKSGGKTIRYALHDVKLDQQGMVLDVEPYVMQPQEGE